MNAAAFDAIRARRAAAGNQKWWWQSEPCYQLACNEAEADFISAARADVDALLAEVDRLRAALASAVNQPNTEGAPTA